jgi:hypothetical protein
MVSAAETEIDTLVAAFYAAFDNRGGVAPKGDELRTMFLREGRVTHVWADGVSTWTVEAFVAPRETMLTDGTLTEFHEWEVEGATILFDNIAERRSRYRKSGCLRGEPYSGEGRKFIQLCRTEGRWRIASVLWEDI